MTEDRRGALLVAAAIVAIGLVLVALDPVFFFHDDVQTQHLPASHEIARAWSHGEWPLLTAASWTAAPLGAEFQYGVFSIFMTLLNVVVWRLGLPIAGVAAALSIVHLVVTGTGAYLLGRAYRLAHALAAMVALIAAWNGYVLMWGAVNWYPVLTSFAWIPWFWLGMERRSIVLTAVSLYLVIAAGWPFTILMAVLIAASYVVPDLIARRWRRVVAAAVAGALGVALASPSLLMLLEHVGSTLRTRFYGGGSLAFTVPPLGFLGAILPVFRTTWIVIYQLTPDHRSIELAGALVPLVALVAAAFLLRGAFFRENARVVFLTAATIVLAVMPSYGMLRFSFRWLALLHLALAIAGARALMALAERRPASLRMVSPWNPGLWATGAVAIVMAVAFVNPDYRAEVLAVGTITIAATAAWMMLDRRAGASAAVGVTLVALFSPYLLVPPAETVPVWRFDDAQVRSDAPFDPAKRYASLLLWRDYLARDLHAAPATRPNPLFRPGNVAMLSNVEYVNSYSPMVLLGLYDAMGMGVHGYINDPAIERLLRLETQPRARFDHLAIDGFVVATRTLTELGIDGFPGWRPVARIDGLELFERVRPMRAGAQLAQWTLARADEQLAAAELSARTTAFAPWVLTGAGKDEQFLRERCSTATLANVRATRFSSRATIDTTSCKKDAVVAFMRPSLQGFAATIGGKPAPLLKADAIMPAVVVPPGTRAEVAVEYRPRSVPIGLTIAALAAIVTIVLAVRR